MFLKKPLMILIAAVMVFAMAGETLADISNAAVLFLRIPTTARSAGMGNAFVAVADDASTNHFNPAGLGAYPLSDTWIESRPPNSTIPITHIAALKTGGGDDHTAWEVWALANGELLRYDNRSWHRGESFGTGADETVEGIAVRQFTTIGDERLDRVVKRVAEANNKWSYGQLETLVDSIRASIPESYSDREDLETGLDSLLALYWECRLNWDRIKSAHEDFNRGLRDGEMTETESDRVNFGVERARNKYLPEDLLIPYGALIDGTPTSLASLSKGVAVGAESGLYYFDGKRWQIYDGSNGVPSGRVRCLEEAGNSLLVGTDSGLVKFNGLVFDSFPATPQLPAGTVTALGAAGTNKIYAIVEDQLYFYDGTSWSDWIEYATTISESLESVAERFCVYQTELDRQEYLEALYELNPALIGKTGDLEIGTIIKAPLATKIRGKVNDIHVGPARRVWLGTDHGVIEFTQNRWSLLGWVEHTVVEGETFETLIDMKRHESEAAREEYASVVRTINEIDGEVQIGDIVKIYRDPRSTEVFQMERWETITFVATRGGLLQTDGTSWRRADVQGLGNQQASSVYASGTQVWFATPEKLVLRARARREVDLMHVKWLPGLTDDLHFGYASIAVPIEGWGTLGLAAPLLHYGTFARTENSPEVIGEFTSFDVAGSVSFGTSLTNKLKGGITAKIIYSRLAEQGQQQERGKGTSTGFAVDLGLLYEMSARTNIGVAVTNLGPEMAYIDAAQSDALPRNLAIGVAHKLLYSQYYRLLVTAEANKLLVGLDDGFKEEALKQTVFNFGSEFQYLNLFAVRAGYIYDEEGKVKTPTFGFGLSPLSWAWLDFAYIPNDNDLPLANTLYTSARFTL